MAPINCAELVWMVEGVLEGAQARGAHLSSCRFHLGCLRRTDWRLDLWTWEGGINAGITMEGQPQVKVKCRVDLLNDDGWRWGRGLRRRVTFEEGCREVYELVDREDLVAGLVPQDRMRVSLRLWTVRSLLPRPLTLSARSTPGVRRTVTCAVDAFSTLADGREVEFPAVDMASREEHPDLKIVLCLEEGRVGARFVSHPFPVTVVLRTVRVGPQIVWQGERYMEAYTVIDSGDKVPLIETQKLTDDAASFLPGDTLTVALDFTDYGTSSTCHAVELVSGRVEPVGRDDSASALALTDLLEQQTLSDCVLRAGAVDESIPVHKCVLSARSPVFRALLTSPTDSKNEVEIPDFRTDIVRLLVRFLYTDSVPDLDPTDALELFSAADKYGVRSLRNRCRRVLAAALSPRTVTQVLRLSDRHSDHILKRQVTWYVRDNEHAVFGSEEWADLEKQHPVLANEVSQYCQLKAQEEKANCVPISQMVFE